ncbi:PleD family two-component system response regulator [Halobacteriovorax sp. RZ-2]|uniref:response regulator n=1 Tax=unclassified Halobacteriovorax TaxID=2639665 RepID=UPI00371A2B0B
MDFSGKSILVVDDDNRFIKIVKKHLEGFGFEVPSSNNLTEAYEYLDENLPDLILLDLNMSSEFGGEFLVLRNRNERLKEVPVCICSANPDYSIAKSVIEMGVDDYIVKPFDNELLMNKVATILNNN